MDRLQDSTVPGWDYPYRAETAPGKHDLNEGRLSPGINILAGGWHLYMLATKTEVMVRALSASSHSGAAQ